VPPDPLAPLAELAGVADAAGRARAAVDRVLSSRALSLRSPELSAESALRGAWASAVLSGADLALADVRREAPADPLVQGALRAQGAVPALVGAWRRAPRQALARLHALAAADLVPAERLGRPSSAPGVAARLDTLATALSTTRAPAVVVAAVVHGELLALDAFPPVSGLVARAAARLTIVERGLDPKGVVPVEVGHLELRADYLRTLSGFRDGTRDGLAGWLVHCAEAVVAGARESAAIGQALQRG
jgi:hypothetical protein